MTLILRWRLPAPEITTRWRGPAGMLDAVRRNPNLPIAAIVGPPGASGTNGSGSIVRIDASLAGTWILPHDLGRIPAVQVFLANGEVVTADIYADASTVTVMFATPQQGFVLLS